MATSALFACTKCNSRHPFEELSMGQQLCKDCRGSFPTVKCTYCRSEFQDSVKGGSSSVCRKCEFNLKSHGKPSACEYCNTIAAFIGSKCQRCSSAEKKYGPPLVCDQCKQRCAFDRKDSQKKEMIQLSSILEDKLLCWLCTVSYRRALAKAKQGTSVHSSSGSLKSSHHHHTQNHKRSHNHESRTKKESHSPSKKIKTEVVNMKPSTTNGTLPAARKESHSPSLKIKTEVINIKPSTNGILPITSDNALLDPSMSDHVVAMTQLKDQIASLQKQLSQKDQQLVVKDRQTSEMKCEHGVLERELRLKIQSMQKQHNEIVDDLQAKVRVLQKQIVTLTKANKKGNSTDSPQRL